MSKTTMARHRTLFIFVLLLDAFVNFGQQSKGVIVSQNNSDTGHVFAIIVGIADYDGSPKGLPALQYANRDALIFYNYLKHTIHTEDTSNIFLLLDRDATRDQITDKLYSITYGCKTGDRIYFYFSGHGDMEHLVQTDNCLLLLSNCPSKNYLSKSNSYLDINLVKQFINVWNNKKIRTYFICDACHSGSLIGGEYGRRNTISGLEQNWGGANKNSFVSTG